MPGFTSRVWAGGVSDRFSAVGLKPSIADLGGGQQLMDLAGDGQLDLVQFAPPVSGFYERTNEGGWSNFEPFDSLPNLNWRDPNLKFIDLTGDGHSDILISEDHVFTWYESLAEEGFREGEKSPQFFDEEKGPRLVIADATQSIFLADMSGDGLTDLVRIRNGEICYWPNLGYGRFGAKVTMDGSPHFDTADRFDQQRIRLADIDGSGLSDIIYLRSDGVHLYFNQSGNSWSEGRRLDIFPPADNLSSVTVVDLFGNGTACLVWSSPLPGHALRPMRYVDLMGGQKPHLMVEMKNNLGAETIVQYAASTKFYLADKSAGMPWSSRLPFPVHVIERVETRDRISRTRFVTRYAYHHGYFDGIEREFRGFGKVEQWDTEEYAALSAGDDFPDAVNIDQASHVPPVMTRTWFHTGFYLDNQRISRIFAREYYGAPQKNDPNYETALAEFTESLLPDTFFEVDLSAEEEREASRALKGTMLREEIYAIDGTAEAEHPFTVTEQNFAVRRIQPKGENRRAVFFTHDHESITYHIERNPDDPRVAHALTLEVDGFGNVLKSAAISYGRSQNDPALDPADQARQSTLLITTTENDFTGIIDSTGDYRTPLLCETRSYELTGLALPSGHDRFTFDEVASAAATATPIDYEQSPTVGKKQKRVIDGKRSIYRLNDLSGPLPLGQMESLALLYESHRLAFTPGLITGVYGGRATNAMVSDDGRYVHSEGDANWWIPSGRVFYSPGATDTAPQELSFARAHFFIPRRYRDPFHSNIKGTETFVRYDTYDLLLEETIDALGNRMTAGERNVDPTKPLLKRGQDYRVLQPALMMDQNRNRSAVVYDAMGMVVGTALMGKPEDNPVPGDRFTANFKADLTQGELDQFLADPKGPFAATLLDRATSRFIYDLTRYWREPDPGRKQPDFAAMLARETHDSEPAPVGGLKIQVSFSYSDGFGREVQRKIQAEAGPCPKRDPVTGRIITVDGQPVMTASDVSPRWLGSGWAVFNNKGKPVRKFEPFFTDSHNFEFDVRIGVSKVLFYDPLERVAGILHPNHTWEKVVFDPWRQANWDVNDTVMVTDPKTDPDAGNDFKRLQDGEYLPSWHQQRQAGALGQFEKEAALKAAIHAGTPSIVHFDSLGRSFLAVAHNKFKRSDAAPADPPTEEFHITRMLYDIEGNLREVIDARDHSVMRYAYDILGNRIHQTGKDAGERWTLNDVAGKPLYSWDSRDHRFRTVCDQLRRPVESYIKDGPGPEVLVVRTVYGETLPNPETGNKRGKVVQIFDQAGIVISDNYDFKGNLLVTSRRLASEYKQILDWSAAAPLEAQTYISRTKHDALNRPVELTAPDNSVIQPAYNEANLLERVDANLRGAQSNGQPVWTPFVTDIDYDSKGQRTLIDYGNGVRTNYEYDRQTFRIVRMTTQRKAADFPADCPQPPLAGWPGCQVQNLQYTYDPAGNITHIRDDAQQTVYYRNRRVEPSADYTYDAIYRLIEATGREHLGQTGPNLNSPASPDAFNGFHTHLDHPGDGNAMGIYLERYFYDAVGNILAMQHRGSDPANPGWKRCYQYAGDSNRLLSTGQPSNPLNPDSPCAAHYAPLPVHPEQYEYDAHGNMVKMPHLPLMQWNFRDQLQATSQQVINNGGTPETTWYAYDAGGRRVRKVTDRQAATGQTPTRRKERIYLNGFEIYREYGGDGSTVTLERETLHIMDDKQRIALVETRTDQPATQQLIRYQHGNHLGSATLELDDQARIISYEEYYPYGSTSYQAVRSQTEAPSRYRYTGKERDEESGFYYHGARYYAPWLGRWTAADPAGIGDGNNLYRYVSCNPVILRDPLGTDGTSFTATTDDKGKPAYQSTGDQVGKDSEKVGKELWKQAKDSPELKGLKKLVLDPELAKLKTGFKKDWENNKAGVILGGAAVLVPTVALLTYFTIEDKKLDVPIAGEVQTRQIGFAALSGALGLASDALFDDKAKFDISYENKAGKERFGYQQTMPFMTDKLKLNFDSRFGTNYEKLGLGFDYTPRTDVKYSISASGESDEGKTTITGKLGVKTPIGGVPFKFGVTGTYKTSPDAGKPPFTASAEALLEPKVFGTRLLIGAQGFVGATPSKDSPFMSKTALDIVPQGAMPTFTPLGSGVFFSLTIPTGKPDKK